MRLQRRLAWVGAAAALAIQTGAVRADGPADNIPENVRPVPPPGITVSADDRAALQAGLAELGAEIQALRSELRSKASLLELLPDVEIYHKAVRYALDYNEFFNAREIPVAKSLLQQGLSRARELHAGKPSWPTAGGLVVRGYRSKIDGSVQPYGLVMPAGYSPDSGVKRRVDCWFHGRGETLSELNFINDRQRNPGEFTPPGAIVLHLYGRYCNANKLAGEVDLFEALDSVKKRYPVDDNRIVVRGFSMGGAACWQFAVHYAGDWAAAAPGAGFSETADFLKVFQKETVKPTWWEQKLWHMYDCTDYAVNLFNCPTVAYSGEIDSQKQAADMMEKALKREGISMTHVIGPKTAHSYEPNAKREVSRRIDSIVARGRNAAPPVVRFTTWTLRYNRMLWVQVDGLEKHWERARVDATLVDLAALRQRASTAGEMLPDPLVEVSAITRNVSALTFQFEPGLCPFDVTRAPMVRLDRQTVTAPPVQSDRSWTAHFRKVGGRWAAVESPGMEGLAKRPGLQGPIDDAFLERFIMVTPTGQPMNPQVGAWAASEQKHALEQWRKQFRGDAIVKSDSEVSDEDIASSNLILWGDPKSNRVLSRIADRLPIRWDERGVRVGGKVYSAAGNAPVLVYPNPLNSMRYVVVNSGFTFREYDYLNNARQVPKLPDWAVVDLSVKPNSRYPGRIADAGFFDERWQLQAAR